MITLLIFALVFAGLIFALGEVVSHDGYAHRPIPRSHIDPFPRSPFELFNDSHNRLV